MTGPNPGAPGPGGPGWAPPRVFCFACGASIDARAELCPACGVRQPLRSGAAASTADPDAPSKVVAGVLAILVGGLGVHRFYLGNVGLGILYALFSWTSIPSVIGLIEGIVFLAKSDEAWAREHPVGRGGPRSIAIGCAISIAIATLIGIVAVVLIAVFAAAVPGASTGSI